APASARPRATALPMPLLPPVMSAARPERLKSSFSMRPLLRQAYQPAGHTLRRRCAADKRSDGGNEGRREGGTVEPQISLSLCRSVSLSLMRRIRCRRRHAVFVALRLGGWRLGLGGLFTL